MRTTSSSSTWISCTIEAPRIGVQAGNCTFLSSSPFDFSCVIDRLSRLENRFHVTSPVNRNAAYDEPLPLPSGGASMRKTMLNTAAKTMRVASGWMSDHAQPRMLDR